MVVEHWGYRRECTVLYHALCYAMTCVAGRAVFDAGDWSRQHGHPIQGVRQVGGGVLLCIKPHRLTKSRRTADCLLLIGKTIRLIGIMGLISAMAVINAGYGIGSTKPCFVSLFFGHRAEQSFSDSMTVFSVLGCIERACRGDNIGV